MLKRLREAGCKSEVIILTAYSDFEYAQNALHYGAADYLLKPFHDGELEQVIVSIHSRLMARQGNAAESLPALQLKKGDKSKYVMESLAYIAGHYNDPDIGVGSIAANAGISEGYLCHIFKKETNYTLMEYLSQYRMHVILLDKNSIEVFANDGEQTMTAWIYTPQSADGITFAADGKATITAEQFELNL